MSGPFVSLPLPVFVLVSCWCGFLEKYPIVVVVGFDFPHPRCNVLRHVCDTCEWSYVRIISQILLCVRLHEWACKKTMILYVHIYKRESIWMKEWIGVCVWERERVSFFCLNLNWGKNGTGRDCSYLHDCVSTIVVW